MFGYRLLRETDFDALLADLRAARAAADALQAQLLVITGERSSAKTMYEGLIPRINQLEMENAQFRNKVTGLPAVAPQLARGNPLEGSAIGAGVDLFEDVGDTRARDMRDKGLLSGDDEPEALPTAAAMSSGLAGG